MSDRHKGHAAADQPAQIRLEWKSYDSLPLVPADMLHYRLAQDRCYLTLGQLQFPLREGSFPDGTSLPIEPVARLVLSRDALRSWADVLHKAADQMDAEIATR